VVGGRCVSSCPELAPMEPSSFRCCPRAQELQVLLEALSASPLGAFLNDSIVGQCIAIPTSNIHWCDISFGSSLCDFHKLSYSCLHCSF